MSLLTTTLPRGEEARSYLHGAVTPPDRPNPDPDQTTDASRETDMTMGDRSAPRGNPGEIRDINDKSNFKPLTNSETNSVKSKLKPKLELWWKSMKAPKTYHRHHQIWLFSTTY